jgi:hypothetical protein
VRLDAKRAALLKRLSQQLGCDTSQVVRLALARLEASPFQETSDSRSEMCSAPAPGLTGQSEKGPLSLLPVPGVGSAGEEVAKPIQPPIERASVPEYTTKVAQLLPAYRAFGMRIWEERRGLFHRLCASAEVACEANESSRDAELRNELLRVGHQYGML